MNIFHVYYKCKSVYTFSVKELILNMQTLIQLFTPNLNLTFKYRKVIQKKKDIFYLIKLSSFYTFLRD